MKEQAFVLRISLGGTDLMPEALANNQIIIGFAQAKGLLNENLSWEEFRTIISETYYLEEKNLRKAGAASGHIWRFIREMNQGDLVIVPYGPKFYVAEVSGPATYDESKVENDAAYRRNVIWQNDKKSIPRTFAKAALISRMKIYGTCAYASDLLPEIKDCIEIAETGSKPTFQNDLQSKLIRQTLGELRGGRMESYGFELLVRDVLVGLGAVDARVIARNQDKGGDIVATFKVAGLFTHVVAVQVKHWGPEPPIGKDVVEQTIRGIEAESANLGMIVTSGTISEEAESFAKQYFDDKGITIELIDGEEFAKIIVERGIKSS